MIDVADVYAEKAREYLKPIKGYKRAIQVRTERIRQLERDLCTIGAVDYSKERLTGGGTPTGLESGVAALVDAGNNIKLEISELIVKREEAVKAIRKLQRVEWRDVLTNTYILGNKDAATSRKMHYSIKRIEQLRRQALVELGKML